MNYWLFSLGVVFVFLFARYYGRPLYDWRGWVGLAGIVIGVQIILASTG